MPDSVAIKVENVSKAFKIPHEKHTSLKSAVLNIFSKKGFTVFEAAKDINFQVDKGEFVGILGRNGSGKSTLLKMLAGIYVPDKGKIKISGRLSPFLELGVGFNPELTARDNVFLGGSILGLTRNEIEEKFDEIIKFSELEEFVDMKFKNFSSGMQVRLAFALSIFAHAEILLMDEVLAVGDNNFQAKCLREFNKYKEQGKTVILVSHDVGTIQKYCDRAILLEQGRVKMIGRADVVGDAYIEQNLEQEKKRRGKESPEKKGISGNDVATLKGATLLNKNGEKTEVLSTGENVDLRINYDIHKKDQEINFSVGLRTEDGVLVFGYTTEADLVEVDRSKKEISLSLDDVNLSEGSYYMNIICYGHELQTQYAFLQRAVEFRVKKANGKRRHFGIVEIEHDWLQ